MMCYPNQIEGIIFNADIKPNPTILVCDSKKEKCDDTVAEKLEEWLDSSFAEELIAERKKVEILKGEKEKTERMLKKRDMVLEGWMKELRMRGESQKELELEVDRLYRLKQLKEGPGPRVISPMHSLRQKVRGKKIAVEEMAESSATDA